jgi:hypothetical protein
VHDLKAGSLKEEELHEENGIANMKYKPFTSKHCTPSRFTSPLNKAGIPTPEGKMESQGEIRPISDLGITEKDLRLGGTMPAGGAGVKGIAKGLIKLGAKAIKKYKESK